LHQVVMYSSEAEYNLVIVIILPKNQTSI